MPTRRSLLRTGGLAGIGTLAAIAALPSPPDATPIDRTVEGAEPPDRVTRWSDEPITTEAETSIARYQYRPMSARVDRTDADAFVATAPINVVVLPDPATGTDGEALEHVMSVLEDEGWLRQPEEYTRYAWDRTEGAFVRQQATAAETYYGTSGRLHVRCWSFDGVVSVQAHEDTGARPKHGIASYKRGRKAMAAIYAEAGWDVSPTAIDLDNARRDYDGMATVITEAS
ncbi:hypothetical protein GS429_13000 [Natronorubrum sp. JWXQ-INN-674]|uniref:Uncharacterized protein n=1 Tax=Natronorubrum halalkaliphilum TaxID=2691917 RepID=A0A6B0VNC8_9EURY|nr:hypothetical protein [Natronorubrum halalkaliphilum]MXV62968.1 hypothetical protein [Natronorubrum halalkaliphilum]